VSGVGDDVNPCSRTAPCKTFAGAISKTAANGKINCLDPGGFGAITIIKSIEIDCLGLTGGILSAGTNGVIVNGAGIRVILRGLEIHGAGNGFNGVRILQAATVIIDKCFITAVTGNAVEMSVGAVTQLFMTDTTLTQMNKGLAMTATAPAAVAYLKNVSVFGYTTSGLEAGANSLAIVTDSMFVGSTTGIGLVTAGNGVIDLANSLVAGNTVGIRVGAAGSRVQMTGNKMFANNASTVVVAGGTLTTGGDNKIDPAGATPGANMPNQ
jgi:nitrous oxidase accessory protein NosD